MKLLCMMIPFLLGVGLLMFFIQYDPNYIILKAYQDICMRAKEKKGFHYGKWENYLKERGAKYHFWKEIEPVSYLGICFIFGMIGMMIGIYNGLFLSSILGILFTMLPSIFMDYLNRKDNEKMMVDLTMIYHALIIQIRAGVYIIDALMECHLNVKNDRLREGLEALSYELALSANIEKGLEDFQKKFTNAYVDSLCITILQALESGKAIELLADIGEQMNEMEVTMAGRKREKLNRSITFYQLGIFAVVMVVILYACVEYLFYATKFLY